jgi:hypothetical protein
MLTGKPVFIPEAVARAQDRQGFNKCIVMGTNPGSSGTALSRYRYKITTVALTYVAPTIVCFFSNFDLETLSFIWHIIHFANGLFHNIRSATSSSTAFPKTKTLLFSTVFIIIFFKIYCRAYE